MFIKRDFNRTEEDDWKLNIHSHLREMKESVPIYDKDGKIVGWNVQDRFE